MLAAATTTTAGGGYSMILILVVFFVIMYFFMIRPEKKKQKKVEQMRSAITTGDEIVTIGGIMGTVVAVTKEDITIETSEDKVRIQLKKWAISNNVRAEAQEANKK